MDEISPQSNRRGLRSFVLGLSQASRSASLPLPLSIPPRFQTSNSTNSYLNSTPRSLPSSYFVSQIFKPNREAVNEVLNRVKPTDLTRFASAFFDHSERISHLLCLLHQSIYQTRSLYAPLHDLIHILSDSQLSKQPQLDLTSNVFLQFNLLENPFPLRLSEKFHEAQLCLTELTQQLESRLSWNLSLWPVMFHHTAQLDAAGKGAYVLNNELDIIDRCVTLLQAMIESDKLLVRIGVERGKDLYPIQAMANQIRKNHTKLLTQLEDLEGHVSRCFITVNNARTLLLEKIENI